MKYAELSLYFGLCNSDGCSEGLFKNSRETEYTLNRYNRAMETVKRYLEPGREWGMHLGYEHLVQSEKEALDLIVFAEQNIRGAHRIIELNSCVHGRIGFFREVRFDKWIVQQQDELVAKLRESGYKPISQHEVNLRYLLIKKPANEADVKSNEEVLIDIEKLDPNIPWKLALKFF